MAKRPKRTRNDKQGIARHDAAFRSLIRKVLLQHYGKFQRTSSLKALGNAAKWGVERTYLRMTLKKHNWELTATAAELNMYHASQVHRLIGRYKLKAEYDQCKKSTK